MVKCMVKKLVFGYDIDEEMRETEILLTENFLPTKSSASPHNNLRRHCTGKETEAERCRDVSKS